MSKQAQYDLFCELSVVQFALFQLLWPTSCQKVFSNSQKSETSGCRVGYCKKILKDLKRTEDYSMCLVEDYCGV